MFRNMEKITKTTEIISQPETHCNKKIKKNLTITIPLTYLFIFQYVNFQEYK